MTRSRALAVVLACMLVATAFGAALTVGIASAGPRTERTTTDVVADTLDVEPGRFPSLSVATGYAAGFVDRYTGGAVGEDRSAADCRSDLMAQVNDHNGTYLDELNQRLGASTSRDVVRVRCVDDPTNPFGETEVASFYLVGTVNTSTGSYDSLRAVENTNRTTDETIVLSGLARDQLVVDLEAYRTKYAGSDKRPDPGYAERMKAKYAGAVHATFDGVPNPDERHLNTSDTTEGTA